MSRTLDKNKKALLLIEECLNDEHPRTGDELVELLEDVYVELGGKIPGRTAA